MAQEVSWETVRVQGEGKSALCAPDTVLTSYAGSSAAYVFTNFGVSLASGVQHQSGAEIGACRIVTRVIIPKGFYLAGLRQSTIAGVIKSIGARGEIRTRLDVKSMGSERIETRVEFVRKTR